MRLIRDLRSVDSCKKGTGYELVTLRQPEQMARLISAQEQIDGRRDNEARQTQISSYEWVVLNRPLLDVIRTRYSTSDCRNPGTNSVSVKPLFTAVLGIHMTGDPRASERTTPGGPEPALATDNPSCCSDLTPTPEIVEGGTWSVYGRNEPPAPDQSRSRCPEF